MTINYAERDCHAEPLSCGHSACSAKDKSIWWLAGTGIAGTVCFDCARLADKSGFKVTIIPTNEQMLAELDWDREDIGAN